MQAASSPFRTAAGVRRALALAGAIAMVVATTACTPDQNVGATPTHVGATSSTGTGTPAMTTSEAPTEVPTSPPPTTPPVTMPPATPGPIATTKPPAPPKPVAAPVIVLRPGDTGPKVRSLQARLRQIAWFQGDVDDRYGSTTTTAVHGFQAKRGLATTGTVDEQTWDKLVSMTHAPTGDELANVVPKPAQPKPETIAWDLDERCMTGRVMCVSKTTKMLTWVVDGVPQYGFDVRFGSDELPTREGVFPVYHKQVDVISNLYHTPMPYSMFFSGGQAVHYSSNFARLGYAGASHGCINVRDKPLLIQLYNEVRIGDKVVVHW